MSTTIVNGYDQLQAADYLSKKDRKLGRWIEKIGPLDLQEALTSFDTVDSLARSILYQQLSGKAAATIVGRVETAIKSKKINAVSLARIDDLSMRACGVSGNKLLALRDLAFRHANGEIPSSKQLLKLTDDEIVARLIPVRGIGRWTVEMMLMFKLRRPNVLPIDDLGVRKGAQVLDKLDVMPTPKELFVRGEKWGPYRSLAAMYCWQIVDAANEKTIKRSQD
jgi:DNA-3-methyladenine glycosylase II